MNTSLSLAALITLLAAVDLSAADMRTWNLLSGATLEAEIVAFPSPESVEIKRADGKVFTLQAAYLTDADRAYLALERAKQWKEVAVNKVLSTADGGRYKKCSVSGHDVQGEIFVSLLPADVESALNARHQLEGQLTNLNSRIQADASAAKRASASGGRRSNRAYQNAAKAQSSQAAQDEKAAKASLAKVKADYSETLNKTKGITTVLMRKTGVVYLGLPVWECKYQPKPE